MSSHNNIPVLVLSLEEAESLKVFGMERESAKNLIKVIRQNKSKLELDNLTKADGNCMVTGIIQQCQRVYPHLPAQIQNLVEGPITLDMVSNFRFAVRQFVFDNQSLPEIQNLRSFLTENWDQYWDKMCKNGEWGDQTFLSCTARFLGANILVVSRSLNTEAMPYTLIPGRDLNAAGDSSDSLFLGFTGTTGHPDNHYQSLLPATRGDVFAPPVFDFGPGQTPQQSKKQQKEEEERERQRKVRAFFNARDAAKAEKERQMKEENLKREEERAAYNAKQEEAALKREKQNRKKAAQRERRKAENPELYKAKQNESRAKSRASEKVELPELYKAKHNQSVAKVRSTQRAKDPELYKAKENENRAKSRANQRQKDEINLKRKQNEEKDQYRQDQRQKDYKKTKTDQNNEKAESRAKRKAETGSDRAKPGVRAAKRGKKEVQDANYRIGDFRQSVMTGPIFICVSCHERKFRKSVVVLTADLEAKIDVIFEPNPDSWIYDRGLVSKVNIEWANVKVPSEYKNSANYGNVGQRYLCRNCKKYLTKKKRLPPCSVMNGLQLQETDQELEAQNLMLTDLEAAMVAPLISFQIIRLLPKSLWANLHNQSVLVPIDPKKINQTLGSLPRTPHEAGLIPIKLKRKQSMVNNHYSQLVQPEKLFKFVKKMHDHGNPFYKDVNVVDEEAALKEFQEKCKNTDPRGFKVVYGDNNDEDESDCDDDLAEAETEQAKAERRIEELRQQEELEDEENYRKNDPVKKFQLIRDETVALIDNCPDIDETIVAPGEGSKPVSPLYVSDWDKKGFPQLVNPDGSGGFDDERPYKIRPQDFYRQRLLNKERRFAKTPTYLYSVVSYLEARRMSSNIAMVGRRGKETKIGDQIEYKLEDAYQVTANVPNGPGYQRKLKQDILAKLDNLGPFQIFFTLSCADLRWDPIFSSILADNGYDINFKCESVDGVFQVEVEARTEQGDWKPLKDFIKEDVSESYHKLVRDNVGLATRYFDHRLKQFISKIVMAKSNLMSVSSYTWRIEMQGRGAAHAHGVLHCHLKKLEKLILVDGQLTSPTENPDLLDKPIDEYERPMEGLSEVFNKLRNDDSTLTAENLTSLRNFIDSFVTVSTHIGTVGQEAAKIAKEVQNHHHTKTCRKHGTECRFKFPRPPAPHTIIQVPVKKEERDSFVQAQKLIGKVMGVVTDPKSVDEIMKNYNKDSELAGTDHEEKRASRIREVCQRADVNYDDYLKALALSGAGYTYHLARDIDEIFINPFNAEWLRAWNGNLDLQVTLDFYAVITYITEYFAKVDTATLNAMKAAVKDKADAGVREKMKEVASKYVRARQIGECEAWYRLLPDLYLSKSNTVAKFAGTGFEEERSHMYRRATKQQEEAGVQCVQLAGKEGLWYRQPDVWSKYLRRPDELEDMCYAQFVMMYDACSSGSKSESENDDNADEPKEQHFEEEEEEEQQQELEQEFEEEEFYEYDFIMTFRDNGNKGRRLPKLIELKDPIPGEAAKLRKRRRAAALRFYKGHKDPERFLHHELMLYSPQREEIPRESIQDMYYEEFKEVTKVSIVKRQVMPFLESVEEARFMLDEFQKEMDLDLTETAVNLDPQAEQERDECAEEGEQDHPDLGHLDPGLLEDINTDSPGNNQPLPYSRIEVPASEELYQSCKKLDKFQIEVVNIAVQYCKDLVKARKKGNPKPVPPLVMANGGAGAGKSTVIDTLTKISQKIVAQDGDDLDCPGIVKVAFTGTAASNINGVTAHSMFNLSFGSKGYTKIDPKKLDSKRAQLKNFFMLVIDEISMISADILYATEARCQEITQRYDLPFGGVAVFVFGDMMQLRPVMAKWIFQKPTCESFHSLHEIAPRWPMFRSIVFEINHRQGEDKAYAELLNRVRVRVDERNNPLPPDDLELLRSRVRPHGHPDLDKAVLWIGCTKRFVSMHNTEYINNLVGDLITLKAINIHPQKKGPYKASIDDKDGTVKGTAFKDNLLLKKGAKIILIHNVDTSDCLTNGQLGCLDNIIETTEGIVDKLVIKFNNPRVGEKSRQKNPTLSAKFPGCVIIERCKFQYSLGRVTAGSTAIVIQFPVWLAHAITCHKIQGQSIIAPQKVVVDIDSVFRNGGPLAYVALSRVQNIEQVFILDRLDENKIKCDPDSLAETERLKLQSWNENPSPWRILDSNSLKIASVNCARLQPHLQYILNDDKLLTADVIHLQETWIEPNNTINLSIEKFKANFVNVGPGKGICTYYQDPAATFEDHKTGNFQVTKMNVQGLVSINVYRSDKGNKTELVRVLERMIDDSQGQPILVSGDFNICTMDEPNNIVTKALKDLDFELLVDVATQIQGRHIDHLYWRQDPAGVWRKPTLETNLIERYSPYYTDHDAWLVTLEKKGSSN